jgi:DNA-binding MarR family transcriptional regulator
MLSTSWLAKYDEQTVTIVRGADGGRVEPGTLGEPRTLDEEVLDLMFQVLGLLKHHFQTAIADMGLSPQQAHALRALDPTRPVPMRELAAGIMCDASTVTGIVDRLEDRGLVERRPDPTDRRVKGLVVTSSGIEVRNRIWQQVLGSAPLLAILSLDERTQLRDQLKRVLETTTLGATVQPA